MSGEMAFTSPASILLVAVSSVTLVSLTLLFVLEAEGGCTMVGQAYTRSVFDGPCELAAEFRHRA